MPYVERRSTLVRIAILPTLNKFKPHSKFNWLKKRTNNGLKNGYDVQMLSSRSSHSVGGGTAGHHSYEI